jgi:magnesium chelatase accessory protein
VTTGLDWTTDGADWPNRAASSFVQAGGLTWHIQRAGSGPKLLLVHGTGASTHSWRGIFPLLAQKYSVLAMDMPGHGFTELPDPEQLSLPGMSASIGALVKSLDFQPDIAMGHSAGAAILTRMCLDGLITPKGVVSINGAILPLSAWSFQFFSPLAKLLFVNPYVPRFFAWTAGDEKRVADIIKQTGSDIDAEGLKFYWRLFQNPAHVTGALGMMANWDLPSMEPDLARLKTRLLLIASGNDKAIPADDAFRVRDKVPGSVVTYFKDRGHLAHEESPAEIAATVDALWTSIVGGEPNARTQASDPASSTAP